jgi:hypothetical protein
VGKQVHTHFADVNIGPDEECRVVNQVFEMFLQVIVIWTEIESILSLGGTEKSSKQHADGFTVESEDYDLGDNRSIMKTA